MSSLDWISSNQTHFCCSDLSRAELWQWAGCTPPPSPAELSCCGRRWAPGRRDPRCFLFAQTNGKCSFSFVCQHRNYWMDLNQTWWRDGGMEQEGLVKVCLKTWIQELQVLSWGSVFLNLPELTSVLLWRFSFDSTFLSQLCVDVLKTCRADNKKGKKVCFSEMPCVICVLILSPAGVFTWTGACWVIGELLSWEQKHDLQRGDGQQRALVGKTQELKTWNNNNTTLLLLI